MNNTMTPPNPPTTDSSEQIIANLVASKMSGEHPELTEWIIALVKSEPRIRQIGVEFSGGGDSGEINTLALYDSDGSSLPDGDLEVPDLLYRFLDTHVSCDWVNNDGGGGELTISLSDLTVRVTSYYYEQVSQECDDKVVPLIS